MHALPHVRLTGARYRGAFPGVIHLLYQYLSRDVSVLFHIPFHPLRNHVFFPLLLSLYPSDFMSLQCYAMIDANIF